MNLYSSGKYTPKVSTGFANKEKAKQTLKNISRYNKTYQKQVVITMYNRAKFHPHKTKKMLDAMKIYKTWMDKNIKTKKSKNKKSKTKTSKNKKK